MASDPRIREEIVRKQELEMEMRAVRQAALVRLAKINMDQAIQIATSQQPGKVLICSLDAKGWEEPGKLAKDGVVFYHVIIADEANAGATHVWVNAIDGTLMKTEKELPRKCAALKISNFCHGIHRSYRTIGPICSTPLSRSSRGHLPETLHQLLKSWQIQRLWSI